MRKATERGIRDTGRWLWGLMLIVALSLAISAGKAVELEAFLSGDQELFDGWWVTQVDLMENTLLPVYSAPSEAAYRGAKGKAAVSLNEPFKVLCEDPDDRDWWLIYYDVSASAARVGYVRPTERMRSEARDVLPFGWDNVRTTVSDATVLTDDPYYSRRAIATVRYGDSVTVLCETSVNTERFAYVETITEGKRVRGFMPIVSLLTSAYTEDLSAMEALCGAWRFTGGGEVGGDGFILSPGGQMTWLVAGDGEFFPPKHLQRGGADTWCVIQLQDAEGEDGRRLIMDKAFPYSDEEGRLLLFMGEGGGFYERFDEDALWTYLREKSELTALDHLLEDYLTDRFEAHLGEMDFDQADEMGTGESGHTYFDVHTINVRIHQLSEGYGLEVYDSMIRDTHAPDRMYTFTMDFAPGSVTVCGGGGLEVDPESCSLIPVEGNSAEAYYDAVYEYISMFLHG
ncbi:MAG: hypothetical protein IJ229_07550 [Clostridia bacterium]|nr:hypothetical protein [Clostridia bacterium]